MTHGPNDRVEPPSRVSGLVLSVLGVLLIPVFLTSLRLLVGLVESNDLGFAFVFLLLPAFLPLVYWFLYFARRQSTSARRTMLFIGTISILAITLCWFGIYAVQRMVSS
jgi:drug/metabolite transporter (DMT)-like permease